MCGLGNPRVDLQRQTNMLYRCGSSSSCDVHVRGIEEELAVEGSSRVETRNG